MELRTRFIIIRYYSLTIAANWQLKLPKKTRLLPFYSSTPGFDPVQYSLNNSDDIIPGEIPCNLPFDFSYLERIHDNQNLHQTISSLVALGNSCSSFAALKSDSIIRNLFEDLIIANQDSYKLSQNIHAVKASTRLEIFKRVSLAKEWMGENYQSNITLEDIASIAVMNSQHFLRMFTQIYHITPHQYLAGLNLRKQNICWNLPNCLSVKFAILLALKVFFHSVFFLRIALDFPHPVFVSLVKILHFR